MPTGWAAVSPGWGLSREWVLSSWNEGAPLGQPGEGGVSPATKHLLIIPIRDELKLKGISHSRKTSLRLTGTQRQAARQ